MDNKDHFRFPKRNCAWISVAEAASGMIPAFKHDGTRRWTLKTSYGCDVNRQLYFQSPKRRK
ncbi:hypothetical protein L484_003275 [Morus notabilis]|uniref:Uncharacterized protein n=1 Tax=Morus notabilis TaxID=981085 RepID=W9R0Q1_9ROSA|nr:hypothetical protein L484_003275 [Morus notabilis]